MFYLDVLKLLKCYIMFHLNKMSEHYGAGNCYICAYLSHICLHPVLEDSGRQSVPLEAQHRCPLPHRGWAHMADG